MDSLSIINVRHDINNIRAKKKHNTPNLHIEMIIQEEISIYIKFIMSNVHNIIYLCVFISISLEKVNPFLFILFIKFNLFIFFS